MDFIQLQVNYLDWESPVVQSRRNMEVARKHGKPVVIMEPARGGRLADLPAAVAAPLLEARPDLSQASWAYRFCYNQPGVLTVLSGMSTPDQVRQNVAEWREHGDAFSPREQKALDAACKVLASVPTVPCTNCRYCVKDCPQQIVIPEIMNLLNLEVQTENTEFAKQQYSWRRRRAARAIASNAAHAKLCARRASTSSSSLRKQPSISSKAFGSGCAREGRREYFERRAAAGRELPRRRSSAPKP